MSLMVFHFIFYKQKGTDDI